RSHDLHFFEQPGAMVDGHVRPPFLVVDNESVVRRHVHAVAWSMFERWRVDRGQPSTESVAMLAGGDGETAVAEEFLAWLRGRPSELQASLERIVPESLATALDLRGWTWVERLEARDGEGIGGWLTDGIAEARRDLDDLHELVESAAAERQFRRADALQRT